ncbi:hypothetical protein C8R46DRAFT_989112 [Mycena filopes]|nr:hypothetical protein C8R46DRAFT_989112 [Mycena filopes]
MSLFEYRPPQATIRHRLRYNILPTDEERRRIAGSLSTARDRLLAIPGTGLASAHDASQDKALCDYISEYSSLIAPIRRLNDDVLALIFPVALVSEVVNFGRRRNVYSHPMTLTSISHYWRCVAIRTPEIWSRISVRWPSSGLHRLRECLRNSKDHGLSLDLDLTGRHTQMEVIDELIIHAERWVKLKLTIKDTETLHLLDPVRGRLSRLQQVVFDFDAASPPPAVAFDGFAIAPRLHTVQARLLRRLPCLPSLPFHQITQVAFVNSARPAVWDALQLFLSASCVDVSLDRGFREFFAPGAADPHTNVVVTELHIRDDGATETTSMAMLDTLTTPNLQGCTLSTA